MIYTFKTVFTREAKLCIDVYNAIRQQTNNIIIQYQKEQALFTEHIAQLFKSQFLIQKQNFAEIQQLEIQILGFLNINDKFHANKQINRFLFQLFKSCARYFLSPHGFDLLTNDITETQLKNTRMLISSFVILSQRYTLVARYNISGDNNKDSAYITILKLLENEYAEHSEMKQQIDHFQQENTQLSKDIFQTKHSEQELQNVQKQLKLVSQENENLKHQLSNLKEHLQQQQQKISYLQKQNELNIIDNNFAQGTTLQLEESIIMKQNQSATRQSQQEDILFSYSLHPKNKQLNVTINPNTNKLPIEKSQLLVSQSMFL